MNCVYVCREVEDCENLAFLMANADSSKQRLGSVCARVSQVCVYFLFVLMRHPVTRSAGLVVLATINKSPTEAE